MIDKYFFRRYLSSRNILKYLGAKEVFLIENHVVIKDELYYIFDSAVGKEIYYFNQFEPEMKKIFSRYIKTGDTVVDVGANIGYHTKEFSRLVGEKGKVIAVEPFLTNFNVLKMNCDDLSNVITENFALGNRDGKLELREYEDTAYVSEFKISRVKFTGNTKEVPVKKIDTVFLNNEIDFLKIDVEGGELEVLKGSVKTLRKHHPVVVCEISVDNLRSSDTSPGAMVKFMTKLGYACWGIDKDSALLPVRKGVFKKTYNFLFVYERQ